MDFKDLIGDFSKVTEVKLVYRNKARPSSRHKVKNSRDAYNIFKQTWDSDKIELQEQFRIMLLDNASGCLGVSTISSGGMAMCIADPKLIFATALKAGASAIILAHNHPSGNLKPSAPDTTMSERLAYVGRFLDMPILDHIIVSSEGYYSYADEEGWQNSQSYLRSSTILSSVRPPSIKGGL